MVGQAGEVFGPADAADKAVHVLKVKHPVAGVGRAGPRLLRIGELERANKAADYHIPLGRHTAEGGGAVGADRLQDPVVLSERMAVDVVAEHLLLIRTHLEIRKGRNVGQPGRHGLGCRRRFGERFKQALLAALAVGQLRRPSRHRPFDSGEQLAAVAAKRVDRPSLGEVLDGRLIDERGIEPAAEVVEVAKPAPLLAFGGDRLRSLHAAALDRREAKVDPAVGYGEVGLRGIHVGRGHLDRHPPAVLDVLDERVLLFEVAARDVAREEGRHKLNRKVGLEVGRLPGQEGVCGRVALVEAVARKLLDQRKHLRCPLLREALGLGPRHKLLAEGGDGLELLLADGLDAGVGLRELDATEPLQDPHHLLLVNHHAVGFGEHLLHHGVQKLRPLAAVLHGDVFIDHAPFERPRPVEGVDGNDVEEVVGLHPLEQVADAAAFELEDALCLTAAERGEGGRVVERKGERVGPHAGGLGDDFEGLGDDGEVAEAEEVHLHQAGPLDISHCPLGDHLLLARHPAEWHIFHKRPVGDHDRSGVGADVAGQALDPLGEAHELLDLRVGLAGGGELRARGGGVFERDAELVGHKRHDLINTGHRHPQGPAHVTDRGPGGERAKGADLGHVGLAVSAFDVVDDLASPLLAEVDVDVRSLEAANVEKPLEEEVVFQWADVGEPERIGDKRSYARATGGRGDVVFAGMPHEVPDDQEIAREAERVDHAELAIEPLEHVGVEIARASGRRHAPVNPAFGHAGVPLQKSLQTQPPQLLRGGAAPRHIKPRKMTLAELEVD